jgi:hypothetical protein
MKLERIIVEVFSDVTGVIKSNQQPLGVNVKVGSPLLVVTRDDGSEAIVTSPVAGMVVTRFALAGDAVHQGNTVIAAINISDFYQLVPNSEVVSPVVPHGAGLEPTRSAISPLNG